MSQVITNRMKTPTTWETDDSGGSGAPVSVIALNDDVTPMDYVLDVLATVFSLTIGDAVSVTMKAHKTGSALIGMYPATKAEKLLRKVDIMNTNSGNSLRCVIVDVTEE